MSPQATTEDIFYGKGEEGRKDDRFGRRVFSSIFTVYKWKERENVDTSSEMCHLPDL